MRLHYIIKQSNKLFRLGPVFDPHFSVRCEEALALRQRLSFKKKKNPIHPTLGTFEKSSSASNQHFHHSTKLVVRTYNSDLVGRESSRGVGEADG